MTNNSNILTTTLDGIDIEQIISLYPEHAWYEATIAESRYKNVEGLTKATDLRDAKSSDIFKELENFLNEKVEPVVNEYAKNNSMLVSEKEYQLVQYSKGQFFKEHTDATEEFPRKISVLLYLNDNYSGGEIVFTKLDISIKPKKNTLIVFPSSEEFSHSAEPVQSGIKYVVVGFWS